MYRLTGLWYIYRSIYLFTYLRNKYEKRLYSFFKKNKINIFIYLYTRDLGSHSPELIHVVNPAITHDSEHVTGGPTLLVIGRCTGLHVEAFILMKLIENGLCSVAF